MVKALSNIIQLASAQVGAVLGEALPFQVSVNPVATSNSSTVSGTQWEPTKYSLMREFISQ